MSFLNTNGKLLTKKAQALVLLTPVKLICYLLIGRCFLGVFVLEGNSVSSTPCRAANLRYFIIIPKLYYDFEIPK